MSNKAFLGNYFEDFKIGSILKHSTPRTITEGDFATYIALTGSRYPEFSSKKFAEDVGFNNWPLDPLLVFHVVFGKTVPDISLNAVANLGYAECIFHHPVKAGDSLTSTSEVIGLKENSSRKTGVVYVRTKGFNQFGDLVLSYVRWVMVNKKNIEADVEQNVPKLNAIVPPNQLVPPCKLHIAAWDVEQSGASFAFEDYEIGEKLDHRDAMAIEEAEHQMATRLYQNTARVHFDAFGQKNSKIGKRLVYGGVVISTARAISFNGLANAGHILAINAGRHVNPFFAGDTIYAWSQIMDKAEIGNGWGALRIRLVATKDMPCNDFPDKDAEGNFPANVILDLDYWAAIPLRASMKLPI